MSSRDFLCTIRWLLVKLRMRSMLTRPITYEMTDNSFIQAPHIQTHTHAPTHTHTHKHARTNIYTHMRASSNAILNFSCPCLFILSPVCHLCLLFSSSTPCSLDEAIIGSIHLLRISCRSFLLHVQLYMTRLCLPFRLIWTCASLSINKYSFIKPKKIIQTQL